MPDQNDTPDTPAVPMKFTCGAYVRKGESGHCGTVIARGLGHDGLPVYRVTWENGQGTFNYREHEISDAR